MAYQRLEELIARYPMRGIKGPVGTSSDMLDLVGDPAKLAELEQRIADHLAFAPGLSDSTGQVYPALVGLRRGQRAGPGGGRAVQRGDHRSG